MTCETMREGLLQAELAELRGEGESPVAVHVRKCADCRRDAVRIVAMTVGLGSRVSVRRRRRIVAVVVPVAIAAGLVALIWPRGATPSVPKGGTPVVAVPVIAPAAAVATAPTLSRRPHRRFDASRPIKPVAFAPVAYQPAPVPPATQQDEVRKRPRVLTTSDPAITVLWFD